MIESRPPEKCYYCDAKAEFNELADDSVVGVCKKHLEDYISG